MSRCFPYPPPGYAFCRTSEETLIESIKLQKEREKAQRKKDKKREKKERSREKKDQTRNLPKSAAAQGQIHDKLLADTKCNIFTEGSKSETEPLERSSLSEEHGQPVCVLVPSSSSDSTENSNKRKKPSSPSDCSRGPGNIIRIRLSSKKQNEAEQQLCSITGGARPVPPTSGRIEPVPCTSGRTEPVPRTSGGIEPIPRTSRRTEPVPRTCARTEPAPRTCARTEPAPSTCVRTEPAPFTCVRTEPAPFTCVRTEPAPSTCVRTEPAPSTSGRTTPVPITLGRTTPFPPTSRRLAPLSSSSGRSLLLPSPNNLKYRGEDFSCTSTVTNGVQRLPGRPNGEHIVSTSQHIGTVAAAQIEVAPVLDAATSKKQKAYMKYQYLIENWAPPPLAPLDSGDSDWLFQSKPRVNHAEKRQKCENDVLPCPSSSLVSWPRAQYLSEIGVYALPYTVPL